MSLREVRIAGLDYLALATKLLQRARQADPEAGVWEAADLQWWWRTPRASDAIDQLFWADDTGPVAAVVLTDWGRSWGCDPLVVPGAAPGLLSGVWARAMERIDDLGLDRLETLVRDDDRTLQALLAESDFVAGDEHSGITWMNADDRPPVTAPPDGFRLVDRTQRAGRPHPMRRRSGDLVDMRLQQASLYDPELDLAVEARRDDVAGYALFWFDPVTGVGLVEPMRVEDAYQRLGLARSLLTAGIERLAQRGARRLKVGYGTEAARMLYTGAGFRPAATLTSHRWARAT